MESLLIGTLFEADEIDQKTNFYNQVAKDHLGHKRFHGVKFQLQAFTGGFQAGYKNTVGSKEGFQPKTFHSSQANRAKFQKQSVLDFMDEEDIGIAKLGESIQTKQEFDTLGLKQKDIVRQQMGSNVHLGIVPDELICASDNRIGKQILQSLKSSRSEKPIKKIKNDIRQQLQTSKNNYYGLGFDEHKDMQDDFEIAFENEFKSILKKFKIDESELEKMQNQKEQQKIRMNNIFQDDFNYYEENLDIQYNKYEILPQTTVSDAHIEKKQVKIQNLKNLFIKSNKETKLIQTIEEISIPKNFDPTKKVKAAVQDQLEKKKMNYLERSKLLEEGPKMNENISKEVKSKILNVKKFVKGETQEMTDFDIRGYIKDPQKLDRYKKYIENKDTYLIGLANAEMAKEIQEFEQIQNLQYTQQKQKESQTIKDEVQKVLSIRKVVDWWPTHLLCKRFGVVPLNKSKQTFILDDKFAKQFFYLRPNRFENEILPIYQSNKSNQNPEQILDEPKQIIQETLPLEEERPPQSLFKSIFDDSEED